ncbi:MAG: sensor histidine kinase [Flavisolibacter sp.]
MNNNFIFSNRYRLARHLLFWITWQLLWTIFWTFVWSTFQYNFMRIAIFLPVFILYTYPVSHFAIKKLLMKNRYVFFAAFILLWSLLGWYLNIYFRQQVFNPLQELLSIPTESLSVPDMTNNIREPHSLLCMATTVTSMSAAILMKHWAVTQQRWALAEQEKTSAQLELLKAQLHPHFLFNTLNNIYSFALHHSEKTPQMVLKLSSLLSYVLYDCRADQVQLSKELEVMKNYIGLEKERYGDKLEVSVNIEGSVEDKYTAPLLILPFLENAFKHGISEQLEKCWMSFDIVVKGSTLKCKVVNSKNELVPWRTEGVGINNVKKRLDYLYPGAHELKLADEGAFFVVSLNLQLSGSLKTAPIFTPVLTTQSITHQNPLPAS